MAAPFVRKKQLTGFFYGLVAGAVFSLTAWGMDAVKLAGANMAFPFMKFIPALIVCALAGGLAGWLSIRVGHWLVSIILWLLFALLVVWLVLWLPIEGSAELLRFLSPNLTHWIEYVSIDGLMQFRVVGLIVIGIPCLLCGVVENNLVEQALAAQGVGGWIAMLLVAALLLGAAGFAALSFLGIGTEVGYADWGQVLSFARNWITSLDKYWYIVVYPGVTLTLFVMGWNLVGDAMRDVLDPRMRGKS